MNLASLPTFAAWRHVSVRDGFEVMFAHSLATGTRLRGHTTAAEGGVAWTVGYLIETDAVGRTTRAEVDLRGAEGDRTLVLERTAEGRWLVDGRLESLLDGCVDVDLESSAVTNTLPVHRLGLVRGVRHDVPAAYVRAGDLRVQRLDQTYQLVDERTDGFSVAYASPMFGFACQLEYDAAGLVVEYPGLASRWRPDVPPS